MATGVPRVDASDAPDAVQLRPLVARSLQQRSKAIISDAMAVSAFAGMESVALADRARLTDAVLRLIAHAVREGTLDSHAAAVTALGQVCLEAAIDVRAFFNMVYLIERSAIGELSGEESFGGTSETWPVISQMLRRASFDVCATFSETRGQLGSKITDSLTTLHTREVFLAALETEIQRSYRFSRPFALMLIDIDRLAEINDTHGYSAGNFVIERVAIVMRNYFRETDWVARSSGGAIAVLLPEIQRADAQHLANRMRITIQERLQLHDYRSDDQFPVTVSVGVLVAETVDQSVQANQLLVEAEEAVSRAKKAGRNCVELADAVIGRPVTQTREGPSID